MSFSSQAESILYIGDSHSHIRKSEPELGQKRFGNILYDGLTLQGHSLVYHAACGSTAQDWVKGPKTTCGSTQVNNGKFEIKTEGSHPSISTLLKENKINKIIINLGDNLFYWKLKNRKKIAILKTGEIGKSVKDLLNSVSSFTSENCFWIAPTYHIEGKDYLKSDQIVDEFYSQLKASLTSLCTLIDSRSMVNTTETGDGLHHTNSDSQAWAMGVLGKLR